MISDVVRLIVRCVGGEGFAGNFVQWLVGESACSAAALANPATSKLVKPVDAAAAMVRAPSPSYCLSLTRTIIPSRSFKQPFN